MTGGDRLWEIDTEIIILHKQLDVLLANFCEKLVNFVVFSLT